jgi:hypothetical protein
MMNERIKELANIAAGRNIKTSPAVASDMADWAVIEKFAELIVKECMEVARPFYMGTPADSVYYVEWGINRIAENFGVE